MQGELGSVGSPNKRYTRSDRDGSVKVDAFQVRQLNEEYRDWATHLVEEYWGSSKIVSRGRIHRVENLSGFVAVQQDKPVGLTTYQIHGGECEIVSLNSLMERTGVGSALLDAARSAAVSAKCKRLWLVTTNDNTPALRFYQKRGFQLVAVHRNAIERSRQLKPEIPIVGMDGIALRDEIELEMLLSGGEQRPKQTIDVV